MFVNKEHTKINRLWINDYINFTKLNSLILIIVNSFKKLNANWL